ncbi:hypothetical protein [Micromonospora deserti]|uniref:hypothetical protein n=1 Tax=Micromonospora deserti TaxID=2070366 RepID=UPI0018F3981B|nr:hypothetical protein [Micromonospora deserti]
MTSGNTGHAAPPLTVATCQAAVSEHGGESLINCGAARDRVCQGGEHFEPGWAAPQDTDFRAGADVADDGV